MFNEELEILILEIDLKINAQINAIIHHPGFQQLESSWRGLYFLVQCTANSSLPTLKIKFLASSWQEMQNDLQQQLEFDQTHLFKKIYSEEFDHPGGEPFGILIGDYYFKHDYKSLHMLSLLAKIAASAFAPFITAADPVFFGISCYSQLKPYHDLVSHFSQAEYQRWHQLRAQPESRFLALTLPRVLMRAPYHESQHYFANVFFTEETSLLNNYLWGNPSYHYAAAVIHSYRKHHWFYEILNVPGTLHDHEQQQTFCQLVITDSQQYHLDQLGFMSLQEDACTGQTLFLNSPSILRSVDSRMNHLIPYTLAVCRFAHYLKVMMRDKIGSFINAKECEHYLQQWINQYCAANPDLTPELQLKYPLRQARITLQEHPAQRGNYFCQMHLAPQHHTQEMDGHVLLTTTLALAAS